MKTAAANAKKQKFAKQSNAPVAKNAKASKAAKTPAVKRAASSKEHTRTTYAGKKIQVLRKDHGAREGTKRAIGMDIILGAKNTDDALPKLVKAGCDASFIRFAVTSGLVKLV